MAESLIGTGALFHKAVNPAVVVQPVEAPLHLPPLTRVAELSDFHRRNRRTIVCSSDDDGNNPPFPQCAP